MRILIADDDSTIRILLRRLLEDHSDWQVCDEAANGIEAVEKAAWHAPDLVILDLCMPHMNGLQAGHEISRANPGSLMLLITVQELTRHHMEAARSAGFKGAVTKGSGREIVKAVEALFNNQLFFQLERSARVG